MSTDTPAMTSSITAAKQQLRAVMKQRLSTIPHESILSQSRAVFEVLRDFKPYRDARRISVFLSMPAGEIQTDAIVRHALGQGKVVFVPFLHKNSRRAGERSGEGSGKGNGEGEGQGSGEWEPARVMDMVALRGLEDYEALGRDAWGILSVDADGVRGRESVFGSGLVDRAEGQSTAGKLDLILVPGVAFDVGGEGAVRRLGHGKGFYDFFLNRYLSERGNLEEDGGGKEGGSMLGQTLFYGLALREQLLDGRGEKGEQDLDGERGKDGEMREVPMGRYDRRLHGVVMGDGVRESANLRAISAWRPGRDAQ